MDNVNGGGDRNNNWNRNRDKDNNWKRNNRDNTWDKDFNVNLEAGQVTNEKFKLEILVLQHKRSYNLTTNICLSNHKYTKVNLSSQYFPNSFMIRYKTDERSLK